MDHVFCLRVTLPSPDANPADYMAALRREGCEDAIPGSLRPGFMVLDFARSGPTLPLSMAGAHAAVRRAIPGAVGVEVIWGGGLAGRGSGA